MGAVEAVAPSALCEHLRTIHNVKLEVRKELERYVEQFKVAFDY